MTSIAGVILAGGGGTRLGGVRKGDLKIGGRRLIDRAADALAGTHPLLVATGPRSERACRLPSAAIGVADIDSPVGGPLAGLAAAVGLLVRSPTPPEFVLSMAVDTPLFPADFAERALSEMKTGAMAVVGCHAGQPYPTNALWRLAVLADLPRQVMADRAPRSLAILLASLGARHLECVEADGADPFANANTLADLIYLAGRVGFSTGSQK